MMIQGQNLVLLACVILGLDFAGTSACSNGAFYCKNDGHAPVIDYSSRVNDGICDCCDGSDGYDGKTKCSNTCWEDGKVAREKLRKKGLTIRQKDIEQAKLAMGKVEGELLKLKGQEKILKEMVEKIEERKDLIEKAEEKEWLQKEKERKEAEEINKKETKAEDNVSMHNVVHDNAETADQPSQDFNIQNTVVSMEFLVVTFIGMMTHFLVVRKIFKIKYPFMDLTFPEYNGSRSLDFFYIKHYVNTNCIDRARRRYGHFYGEVLFFTIYRNEEVQDEFEGAYVWWTLFETPQEDQKRHFRLTFHRQHYQLVTTRYLTHVLSEGKSITRNQRRRTWLEACRD